MLIDPLRRALRRAYYHLRGYTWVTEYGAYGDYVWDFQGSEDDWIRFQLALMAAAECDDTDYPDDD